MEIKPIPSIPGALARSDGLVKLPETSATMPHGGMRYYKTKWVKGTSCKSSKTARQRHRVLGNRRHGTMAVHRLICEAFHGPPPAHNSVVMHLNENPLDNRPENLRWGTQKENLNAKGFIEYCKSRTGDNNPYRKGLAKRALADAAK